MPQVVCSWLLEDIIESMNECKILKQFHANGHTDSVLTVQQGRADPCTCPRARSENLILEDTTEHQAHML